MFNGQLIKIRLAYFNLSIMMSNKAVSIASYYWLVFHKLLLDCLLFEIDTYRTPPKVL